MLALDSSLSGIEIAESEVLDLFESQPVSINLSGSRPEPRTAYVCAVKKTGKVRVYVALTPERGRSFIYTKSDSGESEQNYRATLQQALEFARSMGFTPERVNLDYGPAMRAVVVKNFRVFNFPGKAKKVAGNAPSLAYEKPPASREESPAAALPQGVSPLATAATVASVAVAATASVASVIPTAKTPPASEKDDQRNEKKAVTDVIVKFGTEMAVLRAEKDALSAKVQELSAAQLGVAAELKGVQAENGKVKAERDKLAQVVAALDTAPSELAAARNELAQLVQEREEAKQRHEELVAEKTALAKSAAALEMELARVQEVATGAERAASSAKDEAASAKKEAIRSTEEAARVREEATTAQEEAARAKEEAFEAREEAARAKEEAFKGRDEAVRAKEEAFKAQEEAARAKEEAFKAREEAARAKEEAFKAQEEAARAKEEAARAREEAGRAEEEAARAREETDHAKEEVARAREKASGALEETARAREEATGALDAAGSAQEDVARALEEAARRGEEAAMARDEAATAREEAATARDEADRAQKEVARLAKEKKLAVRRAEEMQMAQAKGSAGLESARTTTAAASPEVVAETAEISAQTWPDTLPVVDFPSSTEPAAEAAGEVEAKTTAAPVIDSFSFAGFDSTDDFFGDFSADSGGSAIFVKTDRTAIEFGSPADVVELQKSYNVAQVALDGKIPEACEGYICCLRIDGHLQVFAVLHGTRSGGVGVYTPEAQPSDEQGMAAAVAGAVSFHEQVGLMMEPLELQSSAQRAKAIAGCPVLKVIAGRGVSGSDSHVLRENADLKEAV